ncbi:MAG: amidohydrolase family protein [Janthinobacterium lividum]
MASNGDDGARGAVDVHTHFVPERFPAYAGSAAVPSWPSMERAGGCHHNVMIAGKVFRKVHCRCWDDGLRRTEMGEQGIGMQVLSPMPELLSYWMDSAPAAQLLRYINTQIADLVARGAGHYAALAAVPLQDVDAAIAELDFAMHTLGLAGVEIGSNINGVAIGDSRFEPFFAAAESLGAAIFVHPLRAAGKERLIGPPMLEQVLAFPGEIGLSAASMVTGGMMARHPRLRIAFSHGGGTLNTLLPRLEHAYRAFPALRELLTEVPADTVRRFFFDTLVYDASMLRRVLEVIGDEQVMLGTDYPFDIRETDPLGRLAELALPAATVARITHRNAQRWLGTSSIHSSHSSHSSN